MNRMYLTESLERFAWIAADTHQPQRAARLFGAGDARTTTHNSPKIGGWLSEPLSG